MYTALILMTVVAAAIAVPAPFLDSGDFNAVMDSKNMQEEIIMPQKRAALVLDRLLVALEKALHDGGSARYDFDRNEPRTAPLRIASMDADMTGLQRRGQGSSRGRVLRCYFNAVTCF